MNLKLVSRKLSFEIVHVSLAEKLVDSRSSVRSALGSAMVPAMGELISPPTSSLERFTENVRRFSWFRFQSNLKSPVRPSVFGPREKSSTPEGVASPSCTNPGIRARSMFTPRVSSRTSNEPKKNALSETMGPPSVPPHCCRSRVGGSCPSTFEESMESSRKNPKALPENSLVPERVMILITPPWARPNSAS
jgi:hypothetical protein